MPWFTSVMLLTEVMGSYEIVVEHRYFFQG